MSNPPAELDQLPSVSVTWTDQGCLLELSGRMTRQLLDHARDLVYAQTKPATCLTVRLQNTVFTRDLMAMLIAARRHLALSGSNLRIEDPEASLPVQSDETGRLRRLLGVG